MSIIEIKNGDISEWFKAIHSVDYLHYLGESNINGGRIVNPTYILNMLNDKSLSAQQKTSNAEIIAEAYFNISELINVFSELSKKIDPIPVLEPQTEDEKDWVAMNEEMKIWRIPELHQAVKECLENKKFRARLLDGIYNIPDEQERRALEKAFDISDEAKLQALINKAQSLKDRDRSDKSIIMDLIPEMVIEFRKETDQQIARLNKNIEENEKIITEINNKKADLSKEAEQFNAEIEESKASAEMSGKIDAIKSSLDKIEADAKRIADMEANFSDRAKTAIGEKLKEIGLLETAKTPDYANKKIDRILLLNSVIEVSLEGLKLVGEQGKVLLSDISERLEKGIENSLDRIKHFKNIAELKSSLRPYLKLEQKQVKALEKWKKKSPKTEEIEKSIKNVELFHHQTIKSIAERVAPYVGVDLNDIQIEDSVVIAGFGCENKQQIHELLGRTGDKVNNALQLE